MYRFWKRAVSVILSVVLMVTLLPQAEPTAVSAAETLQSAPEYNRDIINLLSDIVGGEESAEEYYQMLQQYGLIDDKGNIINNWKIEKDGKQISLDEIKEIVSGDFNPEEIVWVDGSPVTMGTLAELIAIEEYLDYVRETYFTEKVWTAEQKENALDLVSQLEREGIVLRTANETTQPKLFGSNISHDARVTVMHSKTESMGTEPPSHYEYFDVSLTGAKPGQIVEFSCKAVSGSRKADTSEQTIQLTARKDGTATGRISVTVYRPDPMSDKEPLFAEESSFYLNCYNIKNALFKDDAGKDCENLGVEAKCRGTLDKMPGSLSFMINGNTGVPEDVLYDRFTLGQKNGDTVELTTLQQNLIKWGLVDTVSYVHTQDKDLFTGNPILEFQTDEYKPLVALVTANLANQVSIKALNDPDGQGVLVPMSDAIACTETSTSYLTRFVQPATWQFAVTASDGNNDKEMYNHSLGFKPVGDDNSDYLKWDWNYLIPAGNDMSKESVEAVTSLKKGEIIKSLTFDGGMAYYPLRISKNIYGAGKVYTYWFFDGATGDAQLNDAIGWGNPSMFWDATYGASAVKQYIRPVGGKSYPVIARFYRSAAPVVESISVPEGTYYPGEIVPIIVRYSEPARNNSLLTVNGKTLSPTEKTASNVQTFLWKVEENGDQRLIVSRIVAVNLAGKGFTTNLVGASNTLDLCNTDPTNNRPIVEIDSIVKLSAFTGMSASINNDDPTYPTIKATIGIIADNGEISNNIINSITSDLDENSHVSQSFKVKITSSDGFDSGLLDIRATGQNLGSGTLVTEDVKIHANNTEHDQIYTVELFKKVGINTFAPVLRKVGNTAEELGIAGAVLPAAVYIKEGNLILTRVSVVVSGAAVDMNYEDSERVIYADEVKSINVDFSLNGNGFTFGNTSKVTTLDSDGNPVDSQAHFAWISSNPAIATIDKDGNIYATGNKGDARFTLRALNGGNTYGDENGHQIDHFAEVSTGTLHFDSGNAPFLKVSDLNLTYMTNGQGLTVYLTSNICSKSASGVAFTVEVYCGANTNGTLMHSMVVEGDKENPVSQILVPDSAFSYDYADSNNNYYTIRISTTYEEQQYEGTTHATVVSPPASVRLGRLSNYYVLDSAGAIPVTWEINNFSRFSSGNAAELFELSIRKNGTEIVTDQSVMHNPGTEVAYGNGRYTGSFVLRDLGFTASDTDKNGYRQIYDVSVKAKNGTDSTWSSDSFILYVYDEDALKIWVQPTSDIEKKRGAVGTVLTGEGSESGSLVMSNIPAISQMRQDEIIALRRDISLRNVISANYGDYAWTDLSDRLAWASSNNRVATVNYKQGTIYEDVRSVSYESYIPSTNLLISGLSDGSTTITAKHVLTGMSDTLQVNVETLKDKLYLFQCYPQTETTLTYRDASGTEKTVTSDSNGAAAIYEENGIRSDVYCRSNFAGHVYLGTFYNENLESGERDSAKLNVYPCNNISLRRAAYAYLYVKTPEGNPYSGYVMVRGGVNVNGSYVRNAMFALNSTGAATRPGYEDSFVRLGSDGKLEIAMDQSQWGLGRDITAKDSVSYEFIISGSDNGRSEGTSVYPLYVYVDAGETEDAFVGSGEAVVSFRKNNRNEKHPFILMQYATGKDENGKRLFKGSVLDSTGVVGVSDTSPEAELETLVMWWGEDRVDGNDYMLSLCAKGGFKVASGRNQSEQTVTGYPFIKSPITSYKISMNDSILKSCSVGTGEKKELYLEYYRQAGTLARREELSFKLTNLIGVGKMEDSTDLKTRLQQTGSAVNTNGSGAAQLNTGDEFVQSSLQILGALSFSDSSGQLLTLNISPTNDPTKFVGLMKFSYSTMDDAEYTDGIEINLEPEESDIDHIPDVTEIPWSGASKWSSELSDKMTKAAARDIDGGLDDPDYSFEIGGYMETLIYWDYNTGKWAMQVLDGGFNLGGGLEFEWSLNTFVGPVPVVVSVAVGGQVRLSMDAITASYQNNTRNLSEIDNEYLTKLRLYIYVKAFAGIGIDYSIIALKLGIFGQISLDMTFEWLNRPYFRDHPGESIVSEASSYYNSNQYVFDGQRFVLNGMIGLEFVAKLALISYDKVLFSMGFNAFDIATRDYNAIERLWSDNQANLREAINALSHTGSAGVSNIGGQEYLSVDLAPRMESRDYLEDAGTRIGDGKKATWGQSVIKTALVSGGNKVNITSIENNTNPYAAPNRVSGATRDRLYWLSDMNSTNVNDTSAVRAEKTSGGQTWNVIGSNGKISDDLDDSLKGFGDMQLDVAGDGDFEISAWTRQMVDNGRVAGETVTASDQMVTLYGTEIFARTSNGGTVRLTDNNTPDLAPTVAVKGNRGIVAWRSVGMSGKEINGMFNAANFDTKDTIVYKIYDAGTGNWSSEMTAYNGSSGSVKALTSAMLSNGTAALAYTIDIDGNDSTLSDKEIVYCVIDENGEVKRTVRATNDDALDENPDLTVVRFDNTAAESFVLGWYSDKGNGQSSDGTSKNDLCMLDFDENGTIGGRLAGSLSQMAGGSGIDVTSNFMFANNSDTIDTLSITWVERAAGEVGDLTGVKAKGSIVSTDKPEYDVLRAVKFYTYGQEIGLTSAVNVAEMPEGTLIDSYDIVQRKENGEYKLDAVILGTTYGINGIVSKKKGITVGGEEVTYYVPKSVSNMYDVSESYKNTITVPMVYFDERTVKRASGIGIQFTVRNNGYEPIKKLVFSVDGQETVYEDIVLLPGASASLWADYNVPADAVRDVNYTVTATYQNDEVKSSNGTVNLYRPDLEITDAKIVSEEDGQRVIGIKLNNTQDSALAGSGRKVGLSFYSDATMREEIEEAYLSSVIIDDEDSLKMIDEGGYSIRVTFDAAAYVEAKKNEAGEIPESGIGIYISANVLEEKTNLYGETTLVSQTEPVMNNNTAHVKCENLRSRTDKDVILTSDMEIVNGKTVVNVDLQNTRISTTTEGNLIVSLLDENGNVIEQKQSYRGGVSNTSTVGRGVVAYTSMTNGVNNVIAQTAVDNGLITLGKEGKATASFVFNKEGASIDVSYSNLKLDANNADLASLSYSGIPGISEKSFTANDRGDYIAEVMVDDVTQTTVIASAVSGLAKVTIEGSDDEQPVIEGDKNTASKTIVLVPKEEGSTITVTVKADDGTEKRFILSIKYTADSINNPIQNPTVTPTPVQNDESASELTPEEKTEETVKTEEKVKTVKAPLAERKANTVKLDKKLGVTEKNGKLSFTWGKVPDAEYYELYVVYDDEEFSDAEPIVVEDATKFSLKKIDGKKINRKKNIKYKVVAFKTENGKKVQLGESLTLCAAGTKSKEYTNVSEVTLNKTKKTLEKGKTFKIKADLKLEDESKKLIDPGIKYESSDTSVAKVSSKGKITTVGKGTCYVYVRSATGAYAKIKITVK